MNAQTPNWQWAKSVGGTGDDISQGISTDDYGNVYITGYFGSPSITFGTTTLNSAGGFDIFVVKYDAFGNVLWAKSAGGSGDDMGQGISADADGNVYVTGYFSNPSITFGTTTLTCNGHNDVFIAKYNSSGNLIWVKSVGGFYWDVGISIVVNKNGNIYATGSFNSGSITFDSITLINSGNSTIFIVKYDALGNVLWAKSAGGSDGGMGQGITTDAIGNVYVTGFFTSPSITFGNYTLTNKGQWDIFVVKYAHNGNVLWAKSAGGIEMDYGTGIASDSFGNVYITGDFNSPSITFTSKTLINTYSGNSDIFIVKFDPNGNELWAKSYGGYHKEFNKCISTNASGNVYVTGSFYSDSITFGSITLTNLGECDIFIVKFDSNGNALWAKSTGGIAREFGNGITTDVSRNIIVTGNFNSSTVPFGITNLNNEGYNDIFVAKLSEITSIAEENSIDQAIHIYPNPVSWSISLHTEIFVKDATLKVYNSHGQEVKQLINLSGKTFTLNRDNLPGGLYFIHIIENNNIIASGRVIIAE